MADIPIVHITKYEIYCMTDVKVRGYIHVVSIFGQVGHQIKYNQFFIQLSPLSADSCGVYGLAEVRHESSSCDCSGTVGGGLRLSLNVVRLFQSV